MRGLDFFVCAEDMKDLIQYVRNLQMELYWYSGECFCLENEIPEKERISLCAFPIGSRPVIERSEKGATWISQEADCIWLTQNDTNPCLPGGIACESTIPEVLAVYRKIVRYIKKNFVQTFDKVYYIGPAMYDAWKKHKVLFRFYVDAESCIIPDGQFNLEEFAAQIHRKGFFLIESDSKHHRELSAGLDKKAGSYRIFYSGAELRPLFSRMYLGENMDYLDYIKTENEGELEVTINSALYGEIRNRDGEAHVIYHLEEDVRSWMPEGYTIRDFSYFPDSDAVELIHWKTVRKNEWHFIVDSRRLEKKEMRNLWEQICAYGKQAPINV